MNKEWSENLYIYIYVRIFMAARDATIATIERELSLLTSRVEKNSSLPLAYKIHLLADLAEVKRVLFFGMNNVPIEFLEHGVEEE